MKILLNIVIHPLPWLLAVINYYLGSKQPHTSIASKRFRVAKWFSVKYGRSATYTSKNWYRKHHSYGKGIIERTTGSSGEPMKVEVNYISSAIRHSYRLYWNKVVTGKFLPGKFRLWRNRRFDKLSQLKHWINNEKFLTVFDDSENFQKTGLSNKELLEYLDSIENSTTDVLDGYVSMLVYLARSGLFTNRINLSIRTIVCGGETLLQEDRRILQKYFKNAVIFNRYGSTEFSIVGHQCAYQAVHDTQSLHLNEDRYFVEMDDNGEIIITDYHNKAMPFWRYRTGDYATQLVTKRCVCGRYGLTISGLTGRRNILVKSSKGILSEHYFQSILKYIKGLIAYEIHFVRLDAFRFEYVGLEVDESELLNKLSGFEVEFKQVEQLSSMSSKRKILYAGADLLA
jgi:phenylacetate-coenzyme A ligase PaaK-like adenylate-forming protein